LKKALIIQNKGIEEVLLSSVIAQNLKSIYKGVQIHFFCAESAKPVLEHNPFIDRIISFQNNGLKEISNLSYYGNLVRDEKYDIVLDSSSKLRSRFITLKSRAERRIGYNRPFFKHIYTDLVGKKNISSSNGQFGAVDNQNELLKPLLAEPIKFHTQPKVYLTESEKEEGLGIYKKMGIDFSKKTLIIGVLGSQKENSWPVEYMVKLINHIRDYYDFNLILNYHPNQQAAVKKIMSRIHKKDRTFLYMEDDDFRGFLKILYHSDGFLGNEGTAVCLAKALELPTFSIYPPFKFPEGWVKAENHQKHMTVHFRDLDQRTVDGKSTKELIKNSPTLYKKLTYDYVRKEADKFLQNNLGRGNLPEGMNVQLPKISALLITFNEERNIKKYIEEASHYADEIIIVDSESTDRTKSIAEKYNRVKFITRKFDNFTDQRNFAIEQAKNEWITFYDADERIPKSLINEMIDEVCKNEADTFFVYRRFYFMDKYIKHTGWQNDKVARLFKKSKNRFGGGRLVHEQIVSKGKVKFLQNKLDHYSYFSIEEYDRKLTQYSQLTARELFKKGLKPNLFHFWVKPWFRFVHHYFLRYGMLDGREGYIISKLHAHSVFKRYLFLAKMWENDKREKKEKSNHNHKPD